MTGRYLTNAIQTPDGTIIESMYTHDFVCHVDENGKTYCVDGGPSYARRVFDTLDFKDLSVKDDGTHELRRKHLKWGVNFDKEMNRLSKTLWKTIESLDTDHIEAILDGGYAINPFYKEVFQEELKFRANGKNNS